MSFYFVYFTKIFFQSVIGDYTGTTPPMVPPLIIHCVNEIELRDTSEVGLYRVPGSEKDVKTLKVLIAVV